MRRTARSQGLAVHKRANASFEPAVRAIAECTFGVASLVQGILADRVVWVQSYSVVLVGPAALPPNFNGCVLG